MTNMPSSRLDLTPLLDVLLIVLLVVMQKNESSMEQNSDADRQVAENILSQLENINQEPQENDFTELTHLELMDRARTRSIEITQTLEILQNELDQHQRELANARDALDETSLEMTTRLTQCETERDQLLASGENSIESARAQFLSNEALEHLTVVAFHVENDLISSYQRLPQPTRLLLNDPVPLTSATQTSRRVYLPGRVERLQRTLRDGTLSRRADAIYMFVNDPAGSNTCFGLRSLEREIDQLDGPLIIPPHIEHCPQYLR